MWFENLTFGDLIDRAAERWRDREALCFEGRRWSFAALRDEIDRAARALIVAGVGAGDHVCLWLGNRPEHVFLFFAIAKIGAVLVPINTRFRTRDMAYIVVQSDATTLIAADRAARHRLSGDDRGDDPRSAGAEAVGDLRIERRPALRRVILLSDEAIARDAATGSALVREGVRREGHADLDRRGARRRS